MIISRCWVVKSRVLNGMFREGMFAESGGLEMLIGGGDIACWVVASASMIAWRVFKPLNRKKNNASSMQGFLVFSPRARVGME